MESDSKRRQVSIDQLNGLVEFLKTNEELAKGLTRGRRGKLLTLKLWNQCAVKLNVFKDGAYKDGKGWSKYWCDWKYRVRRRALELKAAQDSGRPLPDGITALSPIEENILSIIGANSLDGVVIKCDPLGEQETFDDPNNEEHSNVTSFCRYSVPAPKQARSRKRRHSSREFSNLLDMDSQCSPSVTTEQKHRVNGRNSVDSDDDTAAKFLQLEREKLDNSNSIRDSLKTIASEITRLTDVMSEIKDILVNRINI